MNQPSATEHPISPFAGLLSYLVPGLGQIVQGRTGKGVLFMVCLLSLFFTGQAMGSWKNVYIPVNDPPHWDERFERPPGFRGQRLSNLPQNIYQRWHFLGQFWIGIAAWPALWQYFEMPVPAAEENPFLHNLERAPSEDELNKLLVDSDKTPDLGWIYTVIAGVLNILVIYDACAGPAYRAGAETSPKGKLEEKPT